MLSSLLMLTGALLALQVYDRVLASKSIPTLAALTALAIALIVIMTVFDLIRARMLARTGARLREQLSDAAVGASLTRPAASGLRSGRCDPARDLDQVTAFVSGFGCLALFDMLWAPVFALGAYFIHPVLGYSLGAGYLFLLAAVLVARAGLRRPLAAMGQLERERTAFSEAARHGSGTLMTMGLAHNLNESWRTSAHRYDSLQGAFSDRRAFLFSLARMTRTGLQLGCLALAAYFAVQGEISAGMMMVAFLIVPRALGPFEKLVTHWQEVSRARLAYRHLTEALLAAPQDLPTTRLEPASKSLTVAGLSIVPPGAQALSADGVGFALEAGEGLGIIGPSASGKSSLARALVGIWPAARGEIRLDGATLDQWNADTLAETVSYLPQDVELFDGTVAQNIARFDPKAEAADIIAAARQAGIHELVLAMPHGYETRIGPDGATLSAGHRQRIGLARALYREPFLIVLDEPNAHLDAEGEEALNLALKAQRARGAIVIVVAHRPSAIVELDKLLMLAAGRQTAFGPKDEVLAQVAQAPRTGLKVVGEKS